MDERGNVVGVVSAKVLADGHHARAAFLSSGSLPENVNYEVKSSFLLSFLESVPELLAEGPNAKLKEPNSKDQKFEDVVNDAEKAVVMMVVY